MSQYIINYVQRNYLVSCYFLVEIITLTSYITSESVLSKYGEVQFIVTNVLLIKSVMMSKLYMLASL